MGMTDAQAVRCRKRLERFPVDLLEPVGRSERRHWGEVCARGLLLDGERKSIEPLATRLPEGNVQAVQQFIGQSPWECHPVGERLGKRMTAELEPDSAWVADDSGFPKQGARSVAVERQYAGTLGKTGNRRIAVSVHRVCEAGNVPLGWRLYLPESWAKDAQRRREAGLPEGIVFRKKWEPALEIIDQIRGWGLADRVVSGDAGYGDSTEFREALERRELAYAAGVPPQVGVWLKPPRMAPLKTRGKGRPPTASRYGDQRPTTAQEAARQAKGWRTIRRREGSKGCLESRFRTTRAQPSHRYQDGRPPGKEVWLLAEWPESQKAPGQCCLCDLPADYSLRRIARLVECRWKIERDYRQLEEELGPDRYEGRNRQGWRHHATMVMVARAFLTLETPRSKKNFRVDPAEDAT